MSGELYRFSTGRQKTVIRRLGMGKGRTAHRRQRGDTLVVRSGISTGRQRMARRMTALVTLLVLAVAGCSSTGEPTKTYDGTNCVYDGATEFDLNDEVTFTFTNESDTVLVGFVVWEVPDGTTAELINEVGIFEATGTQQGNTAPYEFFEAKFPPTQLDTEYPVTVVLDTEGLYAVNCFVDTGAEVNTHYATIVTASSGRVSRTRTRAMRPKATPVSRLRTTALASPSACRCWRRCSAPRVKPLQPAPRCAS